QEQNRLKDLKYQHKFLWKVYSLLMVLLALITIGSVVLSLFPLTEHPLIRGAV
ncbi:Uncharacterized protein DAT39_006891, partial [Clarias magur]